MRRFFPRSPLTWLTALAALTISCNDSPTGPAQSAPNGSIVLSDSVFTRGAVVQARVGAPAGYALVPGSVTWTVVSGGASVTDIGGADDSVDVAFTGTGPAQLRASYTLRGQGVGSSLTISGPTRRPGGDVAVEVSRTLTVASALLDYTTLPTASVTAGTPLGNVQVAIKDARGRLITTATDSIVIALDPTAGAAGATLLGTLRARPAAGVATFAGMSIQKAGTGYRLIASSPTLTTRDTATTAVVAGAPSAAQSTIVVADTIRTVGQTTTVTVTLKDQYGNPVLTATPASFSPSASGGTLGAFNCGNGVCTASYTAPNTPGAPTIGATIGATQIPGGPQTVTVVAGAAAKLVITGDSTQAAGSSKNLTITAHDALGNVATSYAGAKSLTFDGASNAATGTVPTIAAANVGTAVNVTFTNGVATLVASVLYKVEVAVLATTDGTISAAGADRLSVRVFNASADAAQSTLAVADSVRSGGDSTTVTVTLKDAYGNPVLDGTAADFTPTASAGTLRTFSCTNGVCTATYVAPATVATHTISATIGATAVGGSPKTVRVPDTTPPVITGPSGAAGDATAAKSVAENTTAVHTMQANEPVTWSISGGADALKFAVDSVTGALTFVAAPDFENATDLGATAGNNTYVVVVQARDANGNVSTQTITVTVTNVVEATRLVITGDSTQAAGTTQNITIRAVDASGNVDVSYTGAKSLTFSGANNAPLGTVPTIGGSNIGTSVNVTFTNGVATLVATTLFKVETAVLATTDGTLSATGVDRLSVRVFAAAASASASTISVASSGIAQNDSTMVTVTLKDAYGNPVINATPASFTPSADIGSLRSFACVNGVCTAQYVGSATGTAAIDARIGGTSVTGGPLSVTIAGAGLYLSPSIQSSVAVNEVTERVVFYVKSGAVRDTVGQLTSFVLASSGGGTFYADPNGTAVVTSASIAAGVDSFVVYYKQPSAVRVGLTDALTATQTAGDAVTTGTANLGITAAVLQAQRLSGIVCKATTGNSNSAALSPTIDAGTNPCTATAGQLLMMVFSHSPTGNPYDMPTFATPAGWTLVRIDSIGAAATPRQLKTYIFSKVATTSGDVSVTFSTGTGGAAPKVRMTYIIAAINDPNATPIAAANAASTITPTAGIDIPSATAISNGSMMFAYAVQDIGSNSYVTPAGLSVVGQAGQGGQAVTMIIFSKDRIFSGPAPVYNIGTSQVDAASTAGVVILNP
ncbi:MAG: invasin domain 3-containing protein [Gemmatimonadota bacterium]|nr:invasin domain 3-containing protein [Gemmatimonadota bacterium]